MNLKIPINKIFNKKPFVKVYSHPRSGTHFLEAFLAKNFYVNKDLAIDEITWGHWSNRNINKEGNPYGKLFGNHYFADENQNNSPKIYIYRDGRAVAYSIWKTPNFLNKNDAQFNFNDFLNLKLDWYGSPNRQAEGDFTVFEHWAKHINSWKELAKKNSNILIIRYEDLKDDPYLVYQKIHSTFFSKQKLLLPDEIDPILKPLGLLPNKGLKDAWKNQLEPKSDEVFKKVTSRNNIDYGC